MKTLILSLPLILIFAVANAQYEKGDIDLVLGGGIGIYGATTNDDTDTSAGVGAACGLLHFTANYAIFERLSLGANFERNGFLIGSDSSNNVNRVFAYAYRLNILFRMVNSTNDALSINGLVGMSSLTFEDRNNDNKAKCTGLAFELGIHYQHIFGEHFGYYINTAYANYKYGKITDKNGNVHKTSNGIDNVVLTLPGVNIRLGLVYRF